MYKDLQEINKAAKLLNESFDRIYVLTIASASSRHQFIKQSLESLDFEFFFGQDKSELSEEDIALLYDDKLAKTNKIQSKSFRASEIAISLSHRLLYEKILKENVRNALIFEDDAFFLEENIKHLPGVFEELPKNWGLLYLGYGSNESKSSFDFLKQKMYLFLRTFGFYKKTKAQINNRFPRSYSEHLKLAGQHDLIHAYAVTSKAAEILIEYQTPIQYLADHLVAKVACEQLVRSFISSPKIFGQGSMGGPQILASLNY